MAKFSLTKENPFKMVVGKICNFTKSKSKFKTVFDFAVFGLFGILFFSIPACSFSDTLYKITWVISILLIVLMLADITIFGTFKIDIVFISLSFFCFSFLISSLLNGIKNFSYTYPLLTIFILIVYIYCKSNNKNMKPLIYSAYVGCLGFLILFIFKYRNELIGLDFDRLGGLFGDENDVAIFNSIGFCLSFYFLFFNSNIFVKIFAFIMTGLFLFVSISSGSKIIIFIVGVLLVYSVFTFNKKTKWWLSLVELALLAGLFILFLNLPFAQEMKKRFLSMLNMFTTEQIKGADFNDYSTINRTNMFINAITMFFRKPLFGWGPRGFAIHSGYSNSWSHNHLSEMLCNTGLFGFVSYHLPFVLCFYYYFKNNKRDSRLAFMLLLLFTTAGISIVLTSEKLFAFIIGVVYSIFIDLKPIFEIDIKKRFNKETSIQKQETN